MRCPFCGDSQSRVIDSRVAREGCAIRRRRQCEACSERYTTYEGVEAATADVDKRDGRAEPFDVDKLIRSMRIACKKRPVSAERLVDFASQLQARIAARPGRTISSQALGEEVMAFLRALDAVAYVRYASVYRSFQTIVEFTDELRTLEQELAQRELDLSPAPDSPLRHPKT